MSRRTTSYASRPQGGFTLIELLVVITIIVVLLALLTPALDRAIYQAELVACGAGADGIGTGVMNYAMNFNRTYPYREGVRREGEWMPRQLSGIPERGPFAATDGGPEGFADDRPMLRSFVPLDAHMCTLAGETSVARSEDVTWVITAYSNMYGFKYRETGGGMYKLGNKLGWNGKRYGVLTGDLVELKDSEGKLTTAHPDANGALSNFQVQDLDLDPITRSLTAHPQGKGTYAEWNTLNVTNDIGVFDLNYAYDDGSVRRFDSAWWDLRPGAVREENRFDRLPWILRKTEAETQLNYIMLPAQ